MARLDQMRIFWRIYKRDKAAVVGLLIVLIISVCGILAPAIAPYDPYEMSDDVFSPPELSRPMGTDNLGRDVFSRVIWGARVSMLFGVVAAGLSLILGVFVGALSGYGSRFVDDVLSRIQELFLMLPTLVLQLVCVAIFGANILFAMVVVGLTTWPSNSKIVRAQILAEKTKEYVLAARGSGARDFRVLFIHLLPNCMSPIIANSTLQMARAIMTEASLSFLGLGDPNLVSWGQILNRAQFHLITAWWMALFPGIMIFLVVLGFNLTGQGVNFALNPKLLER